MRKTVRLIVLVAPLVVGCARTHAKAMPDTPPLDVPAPPARLVDVMDVEAPPPVTLPEEPGRQPVRRPTPPPRAATGTRPAEPPKPETPPETPAVADESPKPNPPTTLQTTPAAQEGEVERGIRATLSRASASLNRVDYRALNTDARTQYDTAKRFIEQADEAVRAKNLVFAKSVADKAAALAAQLAGR